MGGHSRFLVKEHGLSEDEVVAARAGEESDALSERERVLIRFARRVAERPRQIDADDVAQAIQAIERHLPPAPPLSLVLLDVRLPVLDGQQILQYLKRRQIKVPVVAISGHPEALADAAALGADSTVEKPFDFQRLLALVQQTVLPAAG